MVWGSDAKIFLCKWHVKRAWLKNLISKVKTWEKRSAMFKALGSIMESQGNAEHSEQECHEVAMQRLEEYYAKFKDEPVFIEYVKREWENKIGEKTCRIFEHMLAGLM